jgi:hypothetical protein
MIKMAKITYTTATLSDEVGTTPKELRKFLRSDLSGIEKVGKGGRYNLEMTITQVKSIKKNFASWIEAAATKKAAQVETEVEATDHAEGAPTETDLAELDEEFKITDPTDEDLEMIEVDEV